MKPEFEKISDNLGQSFSIRKVERASRPLLSQAWHYHPEIEICYTSQSHGRRFVGNQINEYHKNDLVLIGSNLPHGYTTEVFSSQLVINFNVEFLGAQFINSPELHRIKNLFEMGRYGLEFHGTAKIKAIKSIEKLQSTNGIQQLIELLNLLHILSGANEVNRICSEEYALGLNVSQLGRISIVYDHIMDNFMNDVCIKEISDKLNISQAAFFKFIKKHTKKTYTEIINEFRINYASKLLMNSEKPISQICYEAGYNNLSYFNRKFKEIMNETPLEYRAHYSQNNK